MPFKVKGLREMRANIRKVQKNLPAQMREAVKAEAETILAEAKARTPVRTGQLRASGRVVMAEDELKAAIVFGDEIADYAVQVHEDLEAKHEIGEAKFLERPLMEAAPDLAARLARRIDLKKAAE